MNFLEIAKRVRQECGISGDGPNSVVGQSGISAKLINWVADAVNEIHSASPHWNFDWDRQTRALVDGKDSYDPQTELGLEFRGFAEGGLYIYRIADGVHARHWPEFIPWQQFRQINLNGSAPAIPDGPVYVPDGGPAIAYFPPPFGAPGAVASLQTKGIPIYASLAPDERLHFYPTPSAGLAAVIEYFKPPQVLQSNLDELRIPKRFQMAVVWRAVMFFCASEENLQLYQVAAASYNNLMRRMSVSELPQFGMAEPLA